MKRSLYKSYGLKNGATSWGVGVQGLSIKERYKYVRRTKGTKPHAGKQHV